MDKRQLFLYLLVLVLATVGVYGVSFSNNPTTGVAIALAALAAIGISGVPATINADVVVGVIGFIIVLAAFALAAFALAAITGDYVLAVGLMFLVGALITAVLAPWEKTQGDFSPIKLVFLLSVFFIALNPLVITTRYHNLSQLERDKTIVEAMETKLVNGQLELGLPITRSATEQRYLTQTLTVTVGEGRHSWHEAIRCQEGEKIWYKLVLTNIPAGQTIGFKFRHVWWNYEASRTLPTPEPEI